MNQFSKQMDYLATSIILLCTGLLFLFLNRTLNTYPVLHFSLLLICQSLLLFVLAALSIYRELSLNREAQKEQEPRTSRDSVDSVNATMLLIVVMVLVVGFYMFTLRVSDQIQGQTAPIHMVVRVLQFVRIASLEKSWSMR